MSSTPATARWASGCATLRCPGRAAGSTSSREPSTSTRNNLRSADYLDVANDPTLTFESRRIESVNGRLRIPGDLTIRGVTRSVALDADPMSPEIKGLFGEYRRGTRAVGKISRKEFGLKSNPVLEAGAVGVGDEVEITLEVEFKRKAEGVSDNP